MSTLAAPLGNTPQGAQVAAGNQQLLSSAGNTVQSGQTLDPATMNAAQTLYNTTAQNQASTQTPGGRQGYLDNTNIASQQGNYDALAKQLASYDQMVLQPQFQGSNPGAPSELNGLSGYVNPNLSYNSADARTPDQTLFNTNPTYGLNRQADQGNSIVNLLGTLNTLLSNESKRGTAKYTSDLSNMSSMLGTLNNIFGQNTSLTMKKAELDAANANRVASPVVLKRQGISDLRDYLRSQTGKATGVNKDDFVSPETYAKAKDAAADYGIDPITFDKNFESFRNPKNLFYQVEDQSLSAGQRKQQQTVEEAQTAGERSINIVDDIQNTWNNMQPLEKIMFFPGKEKISPAWANINTTFFTNLEGELRKSVIGGRITQQEIKWVRNATLPQPGESDQVVAAKLDALKRSIRSKLSDPNYDMSTTKIGNSGTNYPNPSGTSGSTSGGFIIKEVK